MLYSIRCTKNKFYEYKLQPVRNLKFENSNSSLCVLFTAGTLDNSASGTHWALLVCSKAPKQTIANTLFDRPHGSIFPSHHTIRLSVKIAKIEDYICLVCRQGNYWKQKHIYWANGSGKQLFLICLSVSVQVWPYPTESNRYKSGDKKTGSREST